MRSSMSSFSNISLKVGPRVGCCAAAAAVMAIGGNPSHRPRGECRCRRDCPTNRRRRRCVLGDVPGGTFCEDAHAVGFYVSDAGVDGSDVDAGEEAPADAG